MQGVLLVFQEQPCQTIFAFERLDYKAFLLIMYFCGKCSSTQFYDNVNIICEICTSPATFIAATATSLYSTGSKCPTGTGIWVYLPLSNTNRMTNSNQCVLC